MLWVLARIADNDLYADAVEACTWLHEDDEHREKLTQEVAVLLKHGQREESVRRIVNDVFIRWHQGRISNPFYKPIDNGGMDFHYSVRDARESMAAVLRPLVDRDKLENLFRAKGIAVKKEK